MQFIDSERFMASSLSNLVNNLSERINSNNVNADTMIKKCKTCGIICKYSKCFLEYKSFKR